MFNMISTTNSTLQASLSPISLVWLFSLQILSGWSYCMAHSRSFLAKKRENRFNYSFFGGKSSWFLDFERQFRVRCINQNVEDYLVPRCVPQTEEPGFVCPAGHEDSPPLRHKDWPSLVTHSHLPDRQDSPTEEEKVKEQQLCSD